MDAPKLLPGTELEDAPFYTIVDAAKAIGCHFQTLRNWVKAGGIGTTCIKGPNSRRLVPRAEVLRVRRKMEAKRAADAPSMGDTSILMRVEDAVGAENTWPLIKRLLSGWIRAYEAEVAGEVVGVEVALKKTDALLHDALAPEQKEKV